MKKSALVFLFILLFVFSNHAQTQPPSPLEQSLIDEINRVRTNPTAYAKWIEDNINNLPYKSEEEKALPEALKVLKSTSGLPAFTLSDGISNAAKAQVKDQLPTGDFSHRGTDGSTVDKRIKRFGKVEGGVGENYTIMEPDAKAMVLSWIIDDLVPDRGHRKNILNKNFNFIGVSCDTYSKPSKFEGQSLCVTPFAQKFSN